MERSVNTKWLEIWNNKDHDDIKQQSFSILDNALPYKPKTILDIGCGLAKESELFQKKYNSFLYLLDGNFDSTSNNSRDVSFGSVNNFKFYSKIDDLKNSFNERKLNYEFIDASKLVFPDKKVDLVYSILSCGFHYPAITYRDFIKNCIHDNSIIIMDIRKKSLTLQKDDFEIIRIIKDYKKHITAQIKFR